MTPFASSRFPITLLALSLTACTPQGKGLSDVANDLEQRTGQHFAETGADETAWPANISLNDGLSDDELVSLALWNNPAFHATLADLGLSRADLVQAGMLPNPTLSMLMPFGAKPLEMTLIYPLEIFWLRPQRIETAKLDVEQTAHRLVQTGLDLIRDVRVAHAELTLAKERLKLAHSSVTLNQNIAELTHARLRAGDASELEVTNAQVDSLQAQEQQGRFRHDCEIAKERLRNLAGLSLEQWPENISAEKLPDSNKFDAEKLLTEALNARPDLRAAEINVESAAERIGLAKAEVFKLTASLNAKQVNGPLLAGPGLDVTLPIVNQNQGGIAQAQARFDKAARQYVATRQRIALDVREAHARLQQASESLKQWQQTILPPLRIAIQDAENAYAAGNVTYLFVLETQRRWLDAQLKTAQAAADLRRARAELERSVGQRLKPA
ncbi:TolC family protein [Methylicorpusculum oleiharenae]|uniref:TolC family protein n=1 Tax=Methylicorpusculum oleiharenae TaxID=1338687 RepID=UPI001357C92F|nr:TolC family protein [Methylicorpusculum oleiharenae]MCD2453658.1 TolC family protein [Methylicorpusculum oleiharenae]